MLKKEACACETRAQSTVFALACQGSGRPAKCGARASCPCGTNIPPLADWQFLPLWLSCTVALANHALRVSFALRLFCCLASARKPLPEEQTRRGSDLCGHGAFASKKQSDGV